MLKTYKDIEIDLYESIRFGHAEILDSLSKKYADKTLTDTEFSIAIVVMLIRGIKVDGKNIEKDRFEEVVKFDLEIEEMEELVTYSTELLEVLKKKNSLGMNTKPISEEGIEPSPENGKS